jgi:hypothetical protein
MRSPKTIDGGIELKVVVVASDVATLMAAQTGGGHAAFPKQGR